NSDNEHFYRNQSFICNSNLPKSIQQPTLNQQQSRRANRTRFTDEQLRFLQDAFEANPYPKDDDLEILSDKLKLNSRVIVVWFQNARQKARKSYENNQNDSHEQVELIVKQEKDEGYSCKNCLKLFSRFAELMKHAKQCSTTTTTTKKNSTNNLKKDLIKCESIDTNCSSLICCSPITNIQSTITLNRKENYCDQCDKHFECLNQFHEHQTFHLQALINAAAFFPLAAYHPA
ncbi:Zinc finger homeobox protein 3, partial [Dictyocoela muelleri]